MADVVLGRPDGVIVLADAIPVSDREKREMDQLLDALGVPKRRERERGDGLDGDHD